MLRATSCDVHFRSSFTGGFPSHTVSLIGETNIVRLASWRLPISPKFLPDSPRLDRSWRG
jgi:hypothetical protein